MIAVMRLAKGIFQKQNSKLSAQLLDPDHFVRF